MDKLELLSSVDLFSRLTQSDLEVLAEHASVHELAAGEHLCRAGTSERELFVIERGEIRIVRKTDDGGEIDAARFADGESLGERDFLSEAPRAWEGVAARESRVLVFPARGTSLDELMAEYPKLFARLLHQFLVVIAGRIRSVDRLAAESSTWVRELRE
jgi:CRP-like cAMP-binding protein